MKTARRNPARKTERLYKLPLVLDPQPEGGYTVTCPIVPELITEGDTSNEALSNVSDALVALLETYQALDRPLPAGLQHAAANAPLWLEAVVTVA